MGCIFLIFSILMPRLAMVIIFLLTNWFNRAFATVLWPVLGFLFMPYTTLAWMLAMLENNHQVTGAWVIVVAVAVVLDLGGHGGLARHRRK
jgi:hypothetical protein